MLAAIYAKLYWTLLASFCVMGLCLAFTQPLFSLPDEPAHWQTAHVRAERFLGQESCVRSVRQGMCPKRGPCSTIPPLELSCTEALPIYGGVFTYPGVLLSKLILPRQMESATRQIQAILLARLLAGLLVVACLVRAGKVALEAQRPGLLVLGAFLLSPLVAQQAFAVSSDGVHIAFGVCLFSAVVAWDRLGWIDLALFLFFGLCSTAKPSLLPCILPAVLAGHWFAQIAGKERPRLMDALRALLRDLKWSRSPSVQTLTLWTAIGVCLLTVYASLHHDAVATASEPPRIARQVNSDALRHDPLLLFRLASTLRYDPTRATHWVGPLGWLDVHLAEAIVNAFWRIALIMLALELGFWLYRLRQQPPTTHAALRYAGHALPAVAVGLTGVAANVLFMVAVMYVLWTDAGRPSAGGVQFRYFIPAVMVMVGVLFRALGGALAETAAPTPAGAPATARRQRLFWAAGLALQTLVLALTLPYVARVYVDLSTHYHHPRHFQ